MSSDPLRKKLIIDPMAAPARPPITAPPARRAMVGADTQRLRTTSLLLPDTPHSSSPSHKEAWLPRLDGGHKLHVEQPKPVRIAGANGQQNSKKIDYPADWRTEHAALREKNLIRRSSRSSSMESRVASNTINMGPRTFDQEPTVWEKPPPVISTGIHGGDGDISVPRPVGKGKALAIISPSPLRNALDANSNHNRYSSRGDGNRCMRERCPGCLKCSQYRANDPREDRSRSVVRIPQHRPTVSRLPENWYTPGAALKGPPGENIHICSNTAGSSTPKGPVFINTRQENPLDVATRGNESQFKLFGKKNFLVDWRKKPKTIDLEERGFDEVPRNRHYEGCILCTPQPSPHSSLTSSLVEEGQGFYAPSRQDPGPPPLTPPPSPDDQEAKEDILPVQVPLFPASFSPIRSLLNQSEERGGNFCEPGPSSQTEDLSYKLHSGGQGPESSYGTSLGRYNGDTENLDWPLRTTGYQPYVSNYSETQEDTNPQLHSREIQISLSPSGSVENLTRVNNLDGSNPVGKKSYMNQDSQASSSKTPGNGGDVHCRRSSLFSVFQGGPASDREKGIKRLPLSNRPTFLRNGNRGIMRLPDDESEGQHPGERKDHQYVGADGVYEMVDLGHQPSLPVVPPVLHEEQQTRMENIKKSLEAIYTNFEIHQVMKFFNNWVVTILLVGAIILAAIIACVMIFVIPAVTLKKVNEAMVGVTAFRITDIGYNYTSVELDLTITSNTNVRTYIKPAIFTLASDNKKNSDLLFGEKEDTRSKLIAGGDLNKYAILGNLWLLNETALPRGDGYLMLKSSKEDAVGFSANDPITTQNLADMAEGLIWGPYSKEKGMNMIIQGDVYMQTQGYMSEVPVSKEISISSMGGFQDFKIDAYQLLQPENGFMDARVTWYNPSIIQMDLGDVEFDLFFGNLAIGNAIIPSMKIIPGDNSAQLSSALFENSTLLNNSTLLGDLFSLLAIEEPESSTAKMLRLKGKTTTIKGFEVLWLLPAVKSFSKDLQIPRKTRILTGLNSNMRLSMETSNIDLKMARIEYELRLPFESGSFPVSVYGADYTLKMSLPSHGDIDFFRIESKVNARNTTVMSGVHTLANTATGPSGGITEDKIFREIFMPDFITSKTIPIEVTGGMIADLGTPFGDGSISGIVIEKDTWEMKGLHNLDGGSEKKVIITSGTVAGSVWTLELQIQNPSDMFVNFGEASFDVIETERPTGCIGTINVHELILDYGSNNINATFDSVAPHCNPPDTAEFLSNYLSGGRNDVLLRVTSHHEVMGLAGLEIGASWISPGYNLVNFIDFVIGGNKVTAEIKLMNPLHTVLMLDFLDMEFFLDGKDTVIATINYQKTVGETIMGGYSRIFSELPVAPTMSIQRFVEILQREMLGDAPKILLTVNGSMGLILADYKVPATKYIQEGVEVKLRWED